MLCILAGARIASETCIFNQAKYVLLDFLQNHNISLINEDDLFLFNDGGDLIHDE